MHFWKTPLTASLFALYTYFLLLPVPSPAAEEPIIIRHHTTQWVGLTNKDGTGLYHEILQRIYGDKNISIKVEYYPLRRGLMNVALGDADISGAVGSQENGLILARHPIWVSRISALFHKSRKESWLGFETISKNGTQAVAPPGFVGILNLDVYEIATRNQALNMVLEGRMAYYVDERETLSKLVAGEEDVIGFEEWGQPTGNKPVIWEDYVIRDVMMTPLYMVFSDSDEGRLFRRIFDEGFARLHRSGELVKIYEKWGLKDKMPSLLVE